MGIHLKILPQKSEGFHAEPKNAVRGIDILHDYIAKMQHSKFLEEILYVASEWQLR